MRYWKLRLTKYSVLVRKTHLGRDLFTFIYLRGAAFLNSSKQKRVNKKSKKKKKKK